MYRVLVTSKSFAKYNEELIEQLREKGIIIERATEENMTPDEIANMISPYDGLVCGIDKINDKIMNAAPNLKVIHMHGTGTDHIDIQEANKRGIYVGNCPGANADAVAELNLAILMAEARKIIQYSTLLNEGQWKRSLGFQLSYKTIGVIGLGHIGKRFIELIKGFNMTVLAYDPYADLEWVEAHNVVLKNDIGEVFKESDFISLNLPLLDTTRHIINKASIELMKNDVIIVNTSRGGLIHTQDLVEAIQSKRIAGAALDVFDIEPLEQDSKLRDLNITLTPHLGASSIETAKKVSEIVAENLINVLIKKDYRDMINYDNLMCKNL